MHVIETHYNMFLMKYGASLSLIYRDTQKKFGLTQSTPINRLT